jgi:hypothetical protein
LRRKKNVFGGGLAVLPDEKNSFDQFVYFVLGKNEGNTALLCKQEEAVGFSDVT